ncbi:MAG: 3-dehydroquinate synthase [Bacteroidota bacterium]
MPDLCAMDVHPVRALGFEAWNELNDWLLREGDRFTSVHILVDSTTHELVLPRFMAEIEGLADAHILEIEPGEASKELAIVEQLALGLRDEGADRGALLIALGGGVVCDLAGLLATLYMRGIELVLVPTSLLAMVDAAWGGKNGVDSEGTKNLLGTWRPDAPVFADLRALETLPEREWRQGWAELVKQAWIAGGALWAEVAQGPWTHAAFWVSDAAEVKLQVVAEDPFERGTRRALLNMGHTVGHAVESMAVALGLDYGHGDCVALGLSVESRILDSLVRTGSAERAALRSRIDSDFQLDALRNLDSAAIWAAMQHDKKKRGGELRIVWCPEPGAAEVVLRVGEADFTTAWNADAAH